MIRLVLFAAVVALVIWSWRKEASPRGEMSPSEAARLLGLSDDADEAAIAEAHKRLISKVHPDAGGSADLAARVNLARDVLLGRFGR
jgi:hypothetical protein